jgi:hypothetical protein
VREGHLAGRISRHPDVDNKRTFVEGRESGSLSTMVRSKVDILGLDQDLCLFQGQYEHEFFQLCLMILLDV